jgi:molybdopterin-containing oxidoreductase family iron-sulfur binding subunit
LGRTEFLADGEKFEDAGGQMTVPNGKSDSIDLAAIEEKLRGAKGKEFWRGLDELAETPRYREFLHNEFGDPDIEKASVSRRDLLKLMAASAAFAGLAGCTKLPTQRIVPYVKQPEEIVPWKPLFYATAMTMGGVARGLLVESQMGRPTKIEGNPDHPASLGATTVFEQAALLTLYDPDRAQAVTNEGRIATWDLFLAALRRARDNHRSGKGAGLSILTETTTSLTLGSQIQSLLAEFPQAKWHQYEPVGVDAAREGARMAFGEYVNTVYRFDRADVILSLDSDFLYAGPGSVRYARQFADGRDVEMTGGKMNRLYVVESTPSITGSKADHRLPMRSRDVEPFARALAAKLGMPSGGSTATQAGDAWISALARDLQSHRGRSVVIAGGQQPASVHALAHAMNSALGNTGGTVILTDPIEVNPTDQMQSIGALVADMAAGHVQTLLIFGGNPVYTAPADLQFAQNFLKVPLRIHVSLYDDETSDLCHWNVPAAHFLETWSDARAFDGTVTILQPLISPLYNGKSELEVLAAFLGEDVAAHDVVKSYWKNRFSAAKQGDDKAFEAFWETSLNDGVVAKTALPEKQVRLSAAPTDGTAGSQANHAQQSQTEGGLEIVFRPDPTMWDGRFANNGWLQELPKPLTQITWDNAVMVSARTAQRLQLTNEDVISMKYAGRALRGVVWITPGHADESVTVYFGYGRTRAGRVGDGVGINTYLIWNSQTPWFGSGLEIAKTGDKVHLVTTQFHHSIEHDGKTEDEDSVNAFDRDLVRIATLDEFKKNPNFAQDPEDETTKAQSLYPAFPYTGYAWGMSIDLNRCIGCNACSIACQAENNIPVVGKEQVDAGRIMHWIRVDTYFRGGLDNPETVHEPLTCMHCENAPCEVVCPVGATTHSPEGLNEMVYNRCVGTRYCSNNCPYKVRRFNFFLFNDWETPSLKLLRNPNVTVRSRGVMEKCSYCVQRINAVKIESEKQDRAVRDGEIVTACQQVCPADAIVFGNINDPKSRVSKLKAQSREYGLLRDLNTRPRTTYLAKLRNPNPEIG